MKLRIGLYCLVGGLPLTISALGTGHFGWWWLSGILLASAFAPVARFGPRHTIAQFGVILLSLVTVGAFCIVWEIVTLFPAQREAARSILAGQITLYLIMAAALAMLAKLLKLTKPLASTIDRRPVGMTLVMVSLSGISYVIYYQIFGSITYHFFTRQYYPDAEKVVLGLGLRFWAIELARGIVMTLAVLPIINTLRMGRRPAALAVGALLWITGGLAPLLVPNAAMQTEQRYIHILEILTQNGLLGITATLLLRPKLAPAVAPMHAATSR